MATYFFDPVINLCYNIYIGRKRRNKYLIQVKKRNGSFEEFTDDKIFNAVKAALVGLTEEETLQTAKTIAEEVTEQAYDGITTERIQETVNEILIRDGFLKTAQDFLEYKNRVAKFSEVAQKLKDLIKPALGAEYTDNLMVAIILNLKHGKAKGYNIGKLYNKFHAFHKAGMTLQDVFRMLEKAASELTTKEEPHWEFVAGNIFAYRIEIETSTYWQGASYSEKVEHMVENKLYGKYLLEYYTPTELNELYNDIVIHDRDLLLNYPAISMLYQRYLVNTHDGKVIERPQELYFRIALHLMMAEPKNKRRNYIRSLYNALSTLKLTMATPTTTNAGTPFHQLSSCFVDTPEDSLDGIFRAITTFSEVSKMGGAEGIYMGNIRANGSAIRGFDGAAGGIIPWGRILNDTAVAVDQLGARQGAVALYLDIWHRDVPEFLESRKNNGDDRLKLHDSFPAIGYPDYFWYLAEHDRNAMWYMFDPHEIENVMGFRLQDYYGEEWEVRYKQCVAEPKLSRRSIAMKDMIKLIIVSLVETGLPFTFNRDNANKNNPNADKGMIYSSNLCVTGDSMLLTEEGYQSFEELYKTQADITAYVDTRARDLDKTKVGLSKEKSSKVFLTKYDAEVWQLETEDGFELKATPYHKFYVERNGRIEKLELKDLVVGDTLLTASGMVDSNLSSDIIAQLQLLWRNFGVVHKENGKTVLDFQIESFENKHIFLANFNLLDIKASMIEVNGIEYIRVADDYSKFMAMTLGILTPELTSVILEEKDINSPTPEFTTKVSAIIPLEEGEDVYDVTVENGHSIIINGIATGNCTEIFMNQSSSKREYKKLEGTDTMVEEVQLGDYPVCNLASLVLGNINLESETELEEIITIAIRALDNVITFNLYPNPLAENTNNKYRAIGLGTSGYHHMLVKRGIKFSSEEHLEFVDKLYEDIFYYALKASNGLAKEKGKCPAFSGSLWETGEYLASRNYTNPRWETLQEKITKTGLRNNYLIATAPTGSTSIISNTTAGIDPLYSRYFLEEKKSNILPRVAPDLDSNTFWLYETAHEVDPMWVVRAAGIRQRHIDQGQSVNMYITPTMKMSEILNILIQANKVGMKSIYYFRGQSLEVEECESCAS